jgi:hypothetical protein
MKREKAAAVVENILGSNDVQEELMINRSRLSALVEAGKLAPIKVLKRESLFWKPEVDKLKQEMMKDSRTNLFKNNGLVKDAI